MAVTKKFSGFKTEEDINHLNGESLQSFNLLTSTALL